MRSSLHNTQTSVNTTYFLFKMSKRVGTLSITSSKEANSGTLQNAERTDIASCTYGSSSLVVPPFTCTPDIKIRQNFDCLERMEVTISAMKGQK